MNIINQLLDNYIIANNLQNDFYLSKEISTSNRAGYFIASDFKHVKNVGIK